MIIKVFGGHLFSLKRVYFKTSTALVLNDYTNIWIFNNSWRYFLYIKNENILENLKNSNQPLYNFLLNKWYFDEIYDLIFTRPAKAMAHFLAQRCIKILMVMDQMVLQK